MGSEDGAEGDDAAHASTIAVRSLETHAHTVSVVVAVFFFAAVVITTLDVTVCFSFSQTTNEIRTCAEEEDWDVSGDEEHVCKQTCCRICAERDWTCFTLTTYS